MLPLMFSPADARPRWAVRRPVAIRLHNLTATTTPPAETPEQQRIRLNAEQAAAAKAQNDRNAAAKAAYEAQVAADKAAYDAAVAAREAAIAKQQAEYDAAMAKWKADTEACQKGDMTRCGKPAGN